MASLKTVLIYPRRIDAEIDASMLEGEGIRVNLLNHESALTELGGAFQIQLQVPEADYDRTVAIIRSKRPDRFGSAEGIKEAEAAVGRGFRRFVIAIAATSLALFIVFRPIPSIGDRVLVTIVIGFALGIPVWLIYEFVRKIVGRG